MFNTYWFGVFIGFTTCLVLLLLTTIPISKEKWKCTHAIMMDNDPSKTECSVYSRKEKEE